jgi:uncharacterized protein YndB with AHSA1/START domain
MLWRLFLKSSRERVWKALVESEQHCKYWCEASKQTAQGFELRFINGQVASVSIVSADENRILAFEYFGSRVTITLQPAAGGIELALVNEGVPAGEWPEVYAGWLNVLLPLKAWVDFGIDLRNHDPKRTWEQHYVDQ